MKHATNQETNGAAPVGRPGQARDPLSRLRRRTLALLTIGQILGGLGMGAALSVGALAVNDLAGAAWSGIAATVMTLGAAVLAVPLARLADKRGRRVSLSTAALIAAAGAAVSVLAMSVGSVVLLFLGLGLIGAATASALQSRFAATDLASVSTRGRDLSLVVWSTTIGAVTGPNLAEPGRILGAAVGLHPLGGVFVFPLVSALLAAGVYLVWMRPDPLLESRRLAAVEEATPNRRVTTADREGNPVLVRVAVLTVALSHATMVALMSMTPVHLVHGGATLSVVGFTLSMHIAGMFALSPVFGVLADRLDRFPTIVMGQILLLGSAVVTALGSDRVGVVMLGLTLLGLGWSASTVAGSALLNDAAPAAVRVSLQGRTDLAMNLAGAIGGAASGPLLALLGYAGLAWTLLVPVAAVVAAGSVGMRRSQRLRVPA
ncbi:MAG TPA: MFS transporter [Propionibacteriaceae bacterium]|nr:MFS transporter [Propionibacteriaceae bacterium]